MTDNKKEVGLVVRDLGAKGYDDGIFYQTDEVHLAEKALEAFGHFSRQRGLRYFVRTLEGEIDTDRLGDTEHYTPLSGIRPTRLERITRSALKILVITIFIYGIGVGLGAWDSPGTPKYAWVTPIKFYGDGHVLAEVETEGRYEILDIYLSGSYTLELGVPRQVYYRTTWKPYHWFVVDTRDTPDSECSGCPEEP